ncbi:hypothetical protein, partial [Methylicorpusculum sp.]|uniref:hypothetical protein n=1 Tax=Methylicorpusculum sp. TaxID=2713644 RepID=UPI002AB9AD48
CSNSQLEGEKGWVTLFEDVSSRAPAVKAPRKGLRRSSKGFSLPQMTLKISNRELLLPLSIRKKHAELLYP